MENLEDSRGEVWIPAAFNYAIAERSSAKIRLKR